MCDNMNNVLYDGKRNQFVKATNAGSITGMFLYGKNDEDTTDLQAAGLDPEELEFMDSVERRELLEKAGLNPDEFDF